MQGKRIEAPCSRAEALRAAFEADCPAYQYRFVEFFVQHVADAARAFDGDLQEMMVLAVVDQAYPNAARTPAQDAADPMDARVSTNASSIAEVSGIPRETVRRKLARLETRGWITRTGPASWHLTVADGVSTARQELADVDRRAMVRIARLVAALEAMA